MAKKVRDMHRTYDLLESPNSELRMSCEDAGQPEGAWGSSRVYYTKSPLCADCRGVALELRTTVCFNPGLRDTGKTWRRDQNTGA